MLLSLCFLLNNSYVHASVFVVCNTCIHAFTQKSAETSAFFIIIIIVWFIFVVKYCFCKQEEYGQMIACDNNKCKIQWFHFDCVGLTDAPKGQWFCENCKIWIHDLIT